MVESWDGLYEKWGVKPPPKSIKKWLILIISLLFVLIFIIYGTGLFKQKDVSVETDKSETEIKQKDSIESDGLGMQPSIELSCGNNQCDSEESCSTCPEDCGQCQILKCVDETSYNQCSITKPLYCNGGALINKCSSCGCPNEQECQINESCITSNIECNTGPCCEASTNTFKSSTFRCDNDVSIEYGCPWGTDFGDDAGKRIMNRYCSGVSAECDDVLKGENWTISDMCSSDEVCRNGACELLVCTDGTDYNQCSTNKPSYCDNGNLIDKCSLCGCSQGEVCENENCVKPDCPYECCDGNTYQPKTCNSGYICIDNNCESCDSTCQQANPGGWLGYQFEHTGFEKFEIIFNWVDTPKTNTVGIYPALLHFWFESNQGGYTGPQIEVFDSGDTIVKKVIFSIWDQTDGDNSAEPQGNCDRFGGEGVGARCMITDYEWVEGKEYKITVQKDYELSDGVIWKATIEDIETGQDRLIGKIKLYDQGIYKGFGLLKGNTGGFFEYYLGTKNNCLEAEYGKIIRKGPYADDMWLARKATYTHTECITAKRYSTETGVIIEEVGEGVGRDSDELLTGTLWEFDNDISIS